MEKYQEHIDAWRKLVFDRAREIDPYDELDWYDLALGFMLGRGLNPKAAETVASHLRYHTDLG